MGTLSPQTIQCGTGARRSREEYLAEVEFVSTDQEINGINNYMTKHVNNNINNNNNGITSGIDTAGVHGYGYNNGLHRVNFESGKDCGSPVRIDDALVYK